MDQQGQLVATSSEQVRRYLSDQGMTDEDIGKYLAQARGQARASFAFGPDELGIAPRYTLVFAEEAYRLTVEHPA